MFKSKIHSKTRIAINLRYLVESQGLTPKQVSDACNIGRNSLSAWASGTYIPRCGVQIVKVAKFLGVSLEDLITKDLSDVD